jgi:molecular chaperone GrpE (heat shock protein)
MAFTRNFLKSTGLSDDQITAVMEEHVAVVDGLKADRDNYKAEADKAAELQKQLDTINSGEDFKAKYEKEHQDFEDFKKKTADEAEAAKVKAAYKSLLVDEKIGAKRLDSIMRVTDFSKMKLNKEGRLDKEDEIRKAINDEWSEFKTTVTERGAKVETPLQTGRATKTKDEIFSIKDTAERQKAIAENHELFGF